MNQKTQADKEVDVKNAKNVDTKDTDIKDANVKEVDIKKYKKCNRIDKNRFAIAYRVEEKETGDAYIAKTIDCEDDEEKTSKLINQKFESIMKLDHPTLRKFIGYSKMDFQDENNLTIITGFGQNGSFADILDGFQKNQQPTDYSNTTRQIIITGIARAMKLLHDHNIIHGDLNAKNIMLNEKNQPFITGFDETNLMIDDKKLFNQNQQKNNVRYYAPEILMETPITEKVDVYAFGILMFEIINNNYAYPELEKGEISDYDFRNKIVKENYRPKFNDDDNINESIKNLIEECWSSDPEKRPTFELIFKKLFISKETIQNSNQYLLENVDIKNYLEYLNKILDHDEQMLYNIAAINEINQKVIKKNAILEKENKDYLYQNDHLKIGNAFLKEQMEEKNKKIRKYLDEIKRIGNGNAYLKEQNEINVEKVHQHCIEIQKLQNENDSHKKEITSLQSKNSSLINENDSLKKEISSLKSKNSSLINENEENSKKISLYDQKNKDLEKIINPIINTFNMENFNSLPLEMQKNVSESMINYFSKLNYDVQNFYIKINDLIIYIQKLCQCKEPGISIHGDTNDCYLCKINENTSVHLNSNTTALLFQSSSFERYDFNQITEKFSHFVVEIDYPTEQFSKIQDEILKIYLRKFQVSLNVLKYKFNSTKPSINKNIINYIKGDITEMPFNDCDSLISVSICSSVTKIKKNAFQKCKLLNQISIPLTVKEIGESAFSECTSLTQISLPSCLTKIEIRVFEKCSSLTQVLIPPSVTSIELCAFNKCTSLKQISIPSSVKIIGDHAFCECTSLNQISIPYSVTIIRDLAFYGCKSLTQISIPSSVTTIGESAFYECTSLSKISISSSITEIKSYTFFKCKSLTEFTIPSSVTKIAKGAFGGCSNLKKMSITSCNKNEYKLHEDTFLICKTDINKDAYDCLLWAKSGIDEIIIPSFIKKIGFGSFEGNSSLTQITIPSSVTSIESQAFGHCTSLKQITIPSSVTSIEYKAFEYCKSLTQITIHSSIPDINFGCFSNCSSLTQITIPSSVQIICDCAFYCCSSLTQISIPSSVTVIGEEAFELCSSLKNIIIPSSVTSIEKAAFAYCKSLTQVTIPSSLSEICDSIFYCCSSLEQITIPSSVTKIEKNAFNKCSSLKQITIPSSVTEIEEYAFSDCSSLEQFTIPSSVTKIAKSTFNSCSSLKQITIPSSVTEIEGYAFSDCSSLEQITIPSSVTEIGNYAFSDCSSLKKIVIPSSIKTENIGIDSSTLIISSDTTTS